MRRMRVGWVPSLAAAFGPAGQAWALAQTFDRPGLKPSANVRVQYGFLLLVLACAVPGAVGGLIWAATPVVIWGPYLTLARQLSIARFSGAARPLGSPGLK